MTRKSQKYPSTLCLSACSLTHQLSKFTFSVKLQLTTHTDLCRWLIIISSHVNFVVVLFVPHGLLSCQFVLQHLTVSLQCLGSFLTQCNFFVFGLRQQQDNNAECQHVLNTKYMLKFTSINQEKQLTLHKVWQATTRDSKPQRKTKKPRHQSIYMQ